MRTRLSIALVALALAAAPPSAAALEYFGNLGLRYDRLDSWTPTSSGTTNPVLQLDGSLAGRGYVVSPSLLRWNAGVGYSTLRASYVEADDRTDNLNYSLSLAALDSPRSRLTLNGSASRQTIDYSQEPVTGATVSTGTSLIDRYDLTLTAKPPSRPLLYVGGSRQEATNSGFGRARTTETTQELNAGTRYGTSAFSVDATYAGRWNEGTLPPANYTQQVVSLAAAVPLGTHTTSSAFMSHRQRAATTIDEFNPNDEYTAVQAGVRWDDPAVLLRGNAFYSYTHQLIEAPSLETVERLTHGLTAAAERAFGPVWSGSATLGTSTSQNRVGRAQDLSASQQAGATIRWNGTPGGHSFLFLELGPKIGVLEPDGAPVELGYGALGRVRWSTERTVTRYSAEYTIESSTNLEAVNGWLLRQTAQADASTVFGSGARFKAYLNGQGVRQDVQLLGASFTRIVQAGATLAWRRYGLGLDVGASDGPTISNEFQGDGLFYPAKFEVRSRYGTLSGSVVLGRRLSFSAFGRYAVVSGESVINQKEASATARLEYGLGRFSLSVENRYAAGGTDTFDNRSNVLFVRLTRNFGGRL